MIFINFKTYAQGSGEDGLFLVKILEEVATDTSCKIIPVVQASDIKEMVEGVTLEVWAQKIDPIDYGAHTGGILPEAVFEDGAMGTFLNHSEAKFDSFENLKVAVKRCHEVGLKTLVFAGDIQKLKEVLGLKPTFVAYEPPELVGSRDSSVAKSKPEVIGEAVLLSKAEGIPLIVGAGIKSAGDVAKSIELGATGIAVASDVVTAKDPKKELIELVSGFRG